MRFPGKWPQDIGPGMSKQTGSLSSSTHPCPRCSARGCGFARVAPAGCVKPRLPVGLLDFSPTTLQAYASTQNWAPPVLSHTPVALGQSLSEPQFLPPASDSRGAHIMAGVGSYWAKGGSGMAPLNPCWPLLVLRRAQTEPSVYSHTHQSPGSAARAPPAVGSLFPGCGMRGL